MSLPFTHSLIHPSRPYPSRLHALAVELAAGGSELREQRRRLPDFAMDRMVALHRFVHVAQADGVGMKHWPAAIAREAVTIDVNDVDVGCPQRDTLFEEFCARVDQRVDAAL